LTIEVTLDAVRRFWSAHPCDSDRSEADDRRRYFEEIEGWRYTDHPSIVDAARFSDFAGSDVLEIGCGVGTDGRQFMRAGANYTGINLDAGSTALANEAIQAFGLEGRVLQMNGEELDFPGGSFDHVYIMGVLMATPHPHAMLGQALRVLRPGGSICAMVYNRSSVNYKIEILGLRRFLRYILVLPGVVPLLARAGFSRDLLQKHRDLVLRRPWMSTGEWLNLNTDGPECPLSGVYDALEVHEMFSDAGFVRIATFVRFLNRHHYGALGRILPHRLVESLGDRWGWHRWVWARKPATDDGD
jgi:SAM-dependent methyltransferase